MELFEQIRKEYFGQKKSIREISRNYKIHRRQVRQAISNAIPPDRKCSNRYCKVLTIFHKHQIDQWLLGDIKAPRKQRHTGKRVYERLSADYAYTGSEITVRNYVYKKRKELGVGAKVYIPQMHIPGEEGEVDWYEASVDFPWGRENSKM